MKNLLLIPILLLTINCCNAPKNSDDAEIKETVTKYWKAIKDNDIETYKNLFDENEEFSGGIQADLFFLHKNYEKINPNNILLKNYKIKDTIVMFSNNKQKYVQYVVNNQGNNGNIKKPLIITLMFYKPVGYNKIYNPSPLKNHIGWDK
ncbi:MAG: hypothetical protein MUW56_21575 [Chryseobacterium sp.]|uniref:hypothetical protein n=1 Tax=Chryseobacterium sp. TaxID=1871047 RepID=UPI0025C02A3F|nr:hypothetical protein [Chryseobacterium sp.]MCJ7936145.1 hypothetical protein [Chryseobacterium sp.]